MDGLERWPATVALRLRDACTLAQQLYQPDTTLAVERPRPERIADEASEALTLNETIVIGFNVSHVDWNARVYELHRFLSIVPAGSTFPQLDCP